MDILVDMDGVVADFVGPVLQRYNRDYNDNLTQDAIKSWNMHENVKPECGKKLYKYFDEKGLFEECPILPDSQKALRYLLKQGHQVFFVTKPVSTSQWCILEKMQWVDRNFPEIGRGNMIFTGLKHLIRGDVLIDDHEKNLEGFPGHRILVDAPWNQHVDTAAWDMQRVGPWVDIVKLIGKMS